jgi:hypothetical protein
MENIGPPIRDSQRNAMFFFWTIVYIASDPTATETIQQELQSVVAITPGFGNNG